MAKATPPKESTNHPAFGLKGRIVTMKAETDVLENATLFIQAGVIKAVVKEGSPIPKAVIDFPVYDTRGTIYPGLIELHNHLSYNCLPIWQAQKKYTNRNQWAGIPLYRKLISGPMNILGKTPGYVEAIVRYVECKCLVAGVTTSQGIMLFSNAGIKKYYQGIVRNVEDPGDPLLPKVKARIPDIAANDAVRFLQQLKKTSCLLLHLSEGAGPVARKHFEALKIDDNTWAITSALVGIHCVALKQADYAIMKKKRASMVWSPLSNLMLYGTTADIAAAKASGITIGIGSDWSPSGSKNLLGELKVAKLYSDNNGGIFSDFEIISMATTNAAKIIKWDKHIGTLEKGKMADLFVVDGVKGDPYRQLLHASEKELNLVVIGGTPRCGAKRLMTNFGEGTETIKVGGSEKMLNLKQDTANAVVGQLQLAQASRKLKKALNNLKRVASETPVLKSMIGPNDATFKVPVRGNQASGVKPSFVLVLDHDEVEGENSRLHIAKDQALTASKRRSKQTIMPKDIPPIKLDLLCVDNDKGYFKSIRNARNLPGYIKTGLKHLYHKS